MWDPLKRKANDRDELGDKLRLVNAEYQYLENSYVSRN